LIISINYIDIRKMR